MRWRVAASAAAAPVPSRSVEVTLASAAISSRQAAAFPSRQALMIGVWSSCAQPGGLGVSVLRWEGRRAAAQAAGWEHTPRSAR